MVPALGQDPWFYCSFPDKEPTSPGYMVVLQPMIAVTERTQAAHRVSVFFIVIAFDFDKAMVSRDWIYLR